MNPLQKQKLNGLLLGSSCLVASVLLGLSPALAGSAAGGLPSGGNVVSGNAKIGGHGSKITQTSEKAFIDWNNFSIGAGETVTIKGPNKNAVTVNRVTGVDRSVIDGVLRANDNVWLLNGNGILFGKGSIINVGSLIATTSDLSDDDFRKGKYRFTTGSNPNASVINKGKITAADGGTVILSAAHVANEGVVKANLGTVVLGGANAFTVDLNGDNLIRYQVTAQVTQAPTDSKGNAQKALVSNSGKIQADGGTVLMTSRAASNVQDNVINNSGMIEATSVSSHNGEVDLDAGTLDTRADGYRKSAGTVDDSGQIDVCGTAKGETGGTVTMTGRNVVVADGARIDAQGYAGGGTVLIGGDFHGHGSLKQAKNVTIGKATINADATHKGDGGKIAIWSRGDTSFDGTVRARGGREGGNGGFVETSGHELGMDASALVNISTTKGSEGIWLLDPTNITIENCGGSCCGSNVSSTAIASSLDAGSNVTVEASGTIYVDAAISGSGDIAGYYKGTGTLSLLAEGSIQIDANIENQGSGAINIVAGWDGSTGITGSSTSGVTSTSVNISAITADSSAYGNNGGAVMIGDTENTVAVGSNSGTTTVAADNVDVDGSDGAAQIGYRGDGTGNIGIFAADNVSLTASGDGECSDCYAQIGNGSVRELGNGDESGNITVSAGGNVTLTGGAEAYSYAQIGNGGDSSVGNRSGNITVEAGGSIAVIGGVDYAQIGNGGWGTDGSNTGNIIVGATSDVTLTGGSSYGSAQIGNGGDHASGDNSGDIAVTAGGSIALNAGSLDFAQIGNGGVVASGSDSGNITVSAAINLSLSGGKTATAYAEIGNGSALGAGTADAASGNIRMTVGGQTSFSSSLSGGAWLGNVASDANESGDVTLITGTESDTGPSSLAAMIEADLGGNGVSGGNVTVGFTNDPAFTFADDMSYSTTHDFMLLSSGNITITGELLNAGSGSIAIVAGWKPSVAPSQVPTTAGAFGNNNASVTIGGSGATGDADLGSATGTTTVLTASLTINGNNGNAQLGYDETGGGDVVVNATGAVSITGASGNFAQIGDGPSYQSNSAGGDVAIAASSISASGSADIIGSTAGITLSSGDLGSAASPVEFVVNSLAINGNGRSAYLTSPQGLSIGVGSDGVALNGGELSLVANGAVTQTQSIAVGSIDISGTSITLTNTGNSFGDATLSASGNASLYDASNLTVDDATIGGNLTLSGGGNIGQSGAITASVLNVTAYHGSITLTNTGNSFGDATLSASGNASLYDASNLTVDDATIGGNLTLSGGGNIDFVASIQNAGNGDITIGSGGTVIIGGANATGNVSVGSEGGATTITADNVTLDAVNGYAQIGYNGNGGGNITIEASGALTLIGGSRSSLTAQIGNGFVQSNGTTASGDISITAGNITLATGSSGEFTVIGNFAASESGNVTIDATSLTGDLGTSLGNDLEGGNFTLALSGNQTMTVSTGREYSSNYTLSITNGGDIVFDASLQNSGSGAIAFTSTGGDVLIGGNGASGNVSVGSEGGATTITADNVTLDAVNGYAQIGYNGNGGGNITIEASGALTLIGGSRSSLTAQIGNGFVQSNGTTASGDISITAGNITLATGSSGEFTVIGNFAASESGNVTIDATSLTGDLGTSLGNDLEGGNFTLALSGNQTMTVSTGREYSSNYTLSITNGGDIVFDASLQNSGSGAIAFTSTGGDVLIGGNGASGNVSVGSEGGATTITADNVTLDAVNGYAQIGYNGNGGGNITIEASGALTLIGGSRSSLTAQIGNGFVQSNGTTASGDISITAGNITLATGSSGEFTVIGNFAASESGNVTIDATSLTGDLGTSLGNDLEGGNFTLALSGNQTMTVSTGREYSSNYTLSITNGGDIVFDASLQNSGSGAIAFTSTGGDVLIGGNGASGNVSVGSEGGATTITADNVTLDAVNGYAQIGYNGNGGGNITIEASGALTLIGGSRSSLTAQIGNGSAFDSVSAVGAVTILAGSLGASGDADVAGTSADIAITGKGNIGSVSDPLEVAVSGLAIQTGGGSAYLTSLQGLSIGVGSDGIDLDGGDLVLSSDGAVTQTQAITASSIDISGASIALTNAGNSFGDATLSSSGNAKLYDASNLTIDSADVGGALTLSGGGNIGQSGAITANALNVTAGNGAITLTNIANSFGDATLAASGNASLYDAADLTVDGADVGGTLTLTGAKSIGQSGAIVASTLDVVANHGVIALTNTGNSIGDADLTSSGNASLYDASALTITGADVGGTLTLTGGGNIGQSGAIDAGTLSVTAKHGSIALTDADNDVTTASLSAHGDVALYDSVDLTVKSADAGGNLTLLTQGNLTFVSSVQLQNGDLLAVAGWDGTTTNPSDLATRGAYGNNGGSITVGGKNAAGDVAIGSANGSTTLAAANVTLDGENGYAQIGYHGAGSGDIDVVASRDVTLTGGAGAGDYAQIGNGGMGTSGDESGNITVDAVGAVALEGGDGKDAYAQIGHGGADADKNSHGYTNSGTIDVKGQTVALLAGAGDESYAQIGHGGFDLGDGLTGQGVNSGNITITAVDGVSLTGNGTDAYTQIGNGGDQVNANAGSSAGGSNSGDIVVAAGAGISMIAGASEDAYAQIGNGGFGTNASGDADPSNFTDSGTITVSDLVLTGSDTGKDAYAQIGNGDASGTGIGDVSGNITIDAGSITVHSGSAAGANAAIGNATGKGTVSGTVAGYTAPSSTTTTDPSTQGVVTSIVSQTSQANAQQVSLVVINPPENQQTSVISDTGTSDETGPLGQLSGDKEGSGNQASDDATDALGQSLGGHRHNIQTVALIPGVLTEVVNTQTVHGIPPADQNFSSWGNEALWRW